MKRKPTINHRQADKLRRAAYDFEELASRLRAAGPDFEAIANGVQAASSQLGKLGRSLDELVERRR